MRLLMNLADKSRQLNQAPFPLKLAYHGPKGYYKIIHQGLMIPDLPAPLHYFNFLSILGQPNAPMLRNDYAVKTHDLDTAAVISSCSSHMVGHFHGYSIQQDCQFGREVFEFGQREKLLGCFPHFQFIREDEELSVNLNITTQPVISHFSKLKLGLFDHWSMLCLCTGSIHYQQQHYQIEQMGSFEFARAIHLPYIPLSFFTYQIINLSKGRQLLLAHIRNSFNQIVQSRLYLRDMHTLRSEMLDQGVQFRVHRVYPKVRTPNGHEMYLPREFEWQYRDQKRSIRVYAESRGDFKFGLAAGYVGSFRYQVQIDDQEEIGESGYCEYIDCRNLKWQEKDKEQKLLDKLANPIPYFAKK